MRICLELHPGTSVYNPESYRALREVTGGNVLVNLDPSHFWWQGIDPVQAIGELDGCIGFAHGKDTTVHADRVERNGVLDFLWPSCGSRDPGLALQCGRRRPRRGDLAWQLVAALRQAGYDGVVSVEHEDPLLGNEEGIDASLAALARVV